MQDLFRRFSTISSNWLGSSYGFVLAIIVSVVWIIFDTQLDFLDIISMLTFDVLFLIQNTQNRDATAIHAKLDEIIRSQKDADNTFIEAEAKPDSFVKELRAHIKHEVEGEVEEEFDEKFREGSSTASDSV